MSDTGRGPIAAGRFVIAGLLLVTMLTPAALADTIYVNGATGDDTWDGLCATWDGDTCGPKATIQAGINAATDGDKVVVADGTYTGEGNKNLDFNGKAITVRSASGDPATCIIDCEQDGRGFYFHSGEKPDAIVDGLTIANGWVDSDSPGGERGGGVYCHTSSPRVTSCIITGNGTVCNSSAGGGGAGVYCHDSTLILSHCLITSNTCSGTYAFGGGVCCVSSSPVLTNCVITDNVVESRGGGVACEDGSSPQLTNCMISGNAASSGGGLCCYHGSPALTNCTITQNAGYGVYLCHDAHPVLSNCILWGNPVGSIYDISPSDPDTTAELTYCDVEGGWEGEGNIDADPLLTPDGHLQAESPCRNAGDPDGDYADQTDMDGEPRLVGGRADIGVDEFLDTDDDALPDWWEALYFGSPTAADPEGDEDEDGWTNLEEYVIGTHPLQPPQTYYVDTGGDDAWDGLAPAWDGTHGPKSTIQAAIDATYSFDEVVVADGTYAGEGNKNLDFGGRAITVRSASGAPETCIIDCEEDGRGLYFHRGETVDSVVSGLTITNGRAEIGGGVYCAGSSPNLTDCTIVNNETGGGNGGGVYCYGSNANFTNCTIMGNVGGGSWSTGGGGVACYGGNPTLIDCTIVDNTAVESTSNARGGGVYCEASIPTLINCAIIDNESEDGGGVYCADSSPTLTNCRILGNVGQAGGGVFFGHDSSLMLINCTFRGNWSSLGGGAVYFYSTGPATLTNCILWGDTLPEIVGGYSEAVLIHCDVQGGWDGEGEGNIDADPLLTPDGHLQAESPCRNAGDPDGDYADQTDTDGEPRLVEGQVDIGVDEFLDTDDDGLPDWWEALYFGSPTAADSEGDEDEDGWTNLEEYVIGTDPTQPPQTYYVDTTGDDDWDGLAPVWDGTHGPKATIQAGLDTASSYHEVVVADGTYTGQGNKNLDFGGKAITLRSASGAAEACIIDCEEDGRGFYFHRGETEHSIVRDFTITNGRVVGEHESGGGVYCSPGSSPTLANCTITGNSVVGQWATGGAVSCVGSSATLTNCTITENTAAGQFPLGGGVCCVEGNPTLANCTIANNTVEGYWVVGAGVYCDDASLALINCTITGNVAVGTVAFGGGVYCYHGNATLTNCILWGNSPQQIQGQGSIVLTYCDVQGGWVGEGNIDADPLFVDPGNQDYHLSAASPCIDAGDPAYMPELGETDLDGHARLLCEQVDMGAYEFGIGDYNCDGVVDLTDFAAWGTCMTGPDSEPYGEGCQAFDFEFDADVDLADFAEFQTVFGT